MQQNHRRSAQRTRRWFLGSLGLATAGLGVASESGVATTASLSSDSEFVLQQGDLCVPVVPIAGDDPIEDRYGWAVEGADFSSTGLVDLQRRDTSILFLYDGPNGLSLVLVHDKYGDGTNGGSVTFQFTGLPLDGEWAVQDDYYDADSNYDQWTRTGDEATVDWTWGESRTDGGAFRGLAGDNDLEIRIVPSFNAEANLDAEHYHGELTAWEVLSKSAGGPTRTSLALDEPIVLRRGSCSTDETGTDEDSTDADRKEQESDDSDDDHRGEGHEKGKGKGHEKGNGKGHEKSKGKDGEKGNGKGHEKHGDDDEDEDDDDEADEEEE